MQHQYSVIGQRIEVGFHAFVSGDDQAFGAVRSLPGGGRHELVVYVENAGDFVVPADAIETVVSQKVIFDRAKLDGDLRRAIEHAHDAEDQDVSTPDPTRASPADSPAAAAATMPSPQAQPSPRPAASGDTKRYPTPSLTALLGAATEPVLRRVGSTLLRAFGRRREAIRAAVRGLPQRMQRVTNQARLATELVDDVQAGVYRDIAWRSIVPLAGALVYAVNPADVIPDVIPGLGTLDDMFVTSVALRLARRQLQRYCAFKGYDPAEYFA